MDLIFMGTPAFAVPSLKALYNSHHKILSVVTSPDKPAGRGLAIKESPVKQFAVEKSLPVLQPENLKDKNFLNKITLLNAELIVVVAFRILPDIILTATKHGSVNLHASLLPKYRGAAPINWAIINGETETGVTTFFIRPKVDTGNIILQKKHEITLEDNAGILHDKLSETGANALAETVDLIEKGKVIEIPQNDSEASYAPKITPEFCKTDWNKPAEKIFNFIRGLSPYPGAYTFYNGKRVKILAVRYNNEIANDKAGDLKILDNSKIFVKCLDRYLEITELQMEGKKRMSSSEFLKGNQLKNGEKFI